MLPSTASSTGSRPPLEREALPALPVPTVGVSGAASSRDAPAALGALPPSPACPPRSESCFADCSSRGGTDALARPGPILDEKCQNVPSEGKRPWRMGRKHYRARSRVRDCMRLWKRDGRVQWWMTFTSAPSSPVDRLRRDFQTWRKRLARLLGVEASEVAYCMVDTHEGHGVLHAVVAFPPGVGAWLDFGALGDWWLEIHGARQVKFKRVGKGDGDVRRLSTYLIAQYMVSQGGTVDLLGRISGSRAAVPVASWRRFVYRLCCSRVQVYEWMHSAGVLDGEAFGRLWRELRSLQYREARRCWARLLEVGWFEFGGSRYAACGREVFEV